MVLYFRKLILGIDFIILIKNSEQFKPTAPKKRVFIKNFNKYLLSRANSIHVFINQSQNIKIYDI